ncbi:hypothetical protein [Shewanella surugensis]|uniref:GGDEF domain-containing protein n=1 Tax=Shewanella surugensis TaxID=212020 RepID=A0ABT0LFL6_9GAMM|nr:hypothetical protein [Shewanella surugensis]MCL1126499.1 hypothetical protein [Shewanella surugensis]
MTDASQRKGPDSLQKLFLYLILIDWFVLIYISFEIREFTFRDGSMASVMLTIFNLILVNLCYRRARRTEDSYLLYPVIGGALLSFILMAYFFFF